MSEQGTKGSFAARKRKSHAPTAAFREKGLDWNAWLYFIANKSIKQVDKINSVRFGDNTLIIITLSYPSIITF